MANKHVLIIDDEPDICELIEMTLVRMGLDTQSAQNLGDAKTLLKKNTYDLCLTDMRLPDGDGLELVSHIQANFPTLPVAVITAHGNMDTAIKALKAGAFDFVSKPVDIQVLRNLVSTATKLPDTSTGSSGETRTTITGTSQAVKELVAQIAKLARSQAPVFIWGESGSGKERVARMIHEQGARHLAPFVPVNCGAIPTELMESEFFGHVKGSFTSANKDKIGLFQAAEGGTLFLDEIAELPLPMQVKLLRAIQEKTIRPVGAQQEIPVDVRLLSASHKKLSSQVESGQFREDLFFRINVIELTVPALRERREDIPQLADQIIASLNEGSGHDKPRLDTSALDALKHYHFPGNVRELENILERAMAMSDHNLISAKDLGLKTDHPDAGQGPEPANMNLAESEKQAIIQALEKTRWNKTAAARLLGLSLRQLRYRLGKFGID